MPCSWPVCTLSPPPYLVCAPIAAHCIDMLYIDIPHVCGLTGEGLGVG